MSYDGQTPMLKLPQWVMSDQLEVGDLNTAFSLLDSFAGAVSLTSGMKRSAAATGSWTPVLEQEAAPIPFSYSRQQGWYALASGFILMACMLCGTALQAVAGTIQISGLPCTPADGFPLTARLNNSPIQAHTQNGCITVLNKNSEFAFCFTCTGLLPL